MASDHQTKQPRSKGEWIAVGIAAVLAIVFIAINIAAVIGGPPLN